MQTHFFLLWFKCLKRVRNVIFFLQVHPGLIQFWFRASFSHHSPCQQSLFISLSRFCVLEKDSVSMNGVRSLLNIPCLLLGYSFKPRPYRRALGTAGSLMTIGLSIIGCLHSENQKTRIGQFKSSVFAVFVKRLRQCRLLPSSLKKTKGRFACRVIII